MNNPKLSFFAQSLDNQSPDHIDVNKRALTEDPERQKVAQQISRVSLRGTQVFSADWHSAFLFGNEFLLQTPSDQLDDADRISRVTCYGRVPDEPLDSWPRDVVKAVVGFAERIGRTISDDNQEMVRLGVEAIIAAKKKRRNWMRVMGKTLLAVGCFLVATIKRTIKIMRLRRHRKKVLWGAGGLVIVLIVLWIIYKIFFKE